MTKWLVLYSLFLNVLVVLKVNDKNNKYIQET